jgi:NifB/MoaA-like Fe-S oxidoreductase
MGPPKVDKAIENLKILLEQGIEIHLQLVVCPGINDGARLTDTLSGLFTEYDGVASVGIVPVGLTGHREGLPVLRGFDAAGSAELLDQIEPWRRRAMEQMGQRWVYAADEFYLGAGRELPAAEDYDGFPQLENGIGLTRLFIDEIEDWIAAHPAGARNDGGMPGGAAKALSSRGGAAQNVSLRGGAADETISDRNRYTVITGSLFGQVLRRLAPDIERAAGVELEIVEAPNAWLGGGVSVAGLLSGSDIVEAVSAARVDGPVAVPDVCLNGDGVFLDGMTPAEAAEAARAEIIMVPTGGYAFMDALRSYHA